MATERIKRLEVRMPGRVYALLERAAESKGRSIPDFAFNAVRDAAQRVVGDEAMIRLSAEDQERFAAALIRPPMPNTALKRAMRRHLENVAMQ